MQKQLFRFDFFNEIQAWHWFFIKLVFIATAILLCGALDAPAQRMNKKDKKVKTKAVVKNVQPDKIDRTDAVRAATGADLPVSVVNLAETDYLSGEASVVINPRQPTVVRLGLAQNAVSIVEFPASDGIYYIHEGNPKLVSVFQSPTRETDRSITVYPGEAFVAGRETGPERIPSATITLQMRSGLILILEFVPVSEVRKNAHRCVINYKRDEIIAARRTAGLAYDLGEDAKPADLRNTRASSKLVGAVGGETVGENPPDSEASPVKLASLEVNRGAVSRRADAKSPKPPKTGLELSRLVNKRLAECLKNPAKNLGKWSAEESGLKLAVSGVTEIDAEQRLVVVAVRNETAGNLRLVSGTPELQIQTSDDKGNALQTERLERLYAETTSFEGLILPGATVYYAIVYSAPVMGASQRLRVLVSHREAADKPGTITLPTAGTDKE